MRNKNFLRLSSLSYQKTLVVITAYALIIAAAIGLFILTKNTNIILEIETFIISAIFGTALGTLSELKSPITFFSSIYKNLNQICLLKTEAQTKNAEDNSISIQISGNPHVVREVLSKVVDF